MMGKLKMQNKYLYFKRNIIYTIIISLIGIIIPLLSYSSNKNFTLKFIEIYQNRWFFLCNFLVILLMNIKYSEIYNKYIFKLRYQSINTIKLNIINECYINLFIYSFFNFLATSLLLILFGHKFIDISCVSEIFYITVYEFLISLVVNIFLFILKKCTKYNYIYIVTIILIIFIIITKWHILFRNILSDNLIDYLIKFILLLFLYFFLKYLLKRENGDE